MAEATKSTVVRTVTEETFTLTLSADEFQYLKDLVGRQNFGDTGDHIYAAMASDLTVNEVTPEPNMAVKVGDRVRILEAPGAERFHGRVGTVLSVLGPHPTDLCTYSVTVEGCGTLIWATKVEHATEPATYTVDGTAYDLSAEYRDAAEDVWFFTGERNEDGVPLMTCRLNDTRYADPVDYRNWPLNRVLSWYTLTRV
ncbi:phiSA1p31-related protein [Streptomyces albidoflavus]